MDFASTSSNLIVALSGAGICEDKKAIRQIRLIAGWPENPGHSLDFFIYDPGYSLDLPAEKAFERYDRAAGPPDRAVSRRFEGGLR